MPEYERKELTPRIATGTVYQIGLSPNRIDILTLIDGVTFDQSWESRMEIDVAGITIPVIGRTETRIFNPILDD